MSNRKGITSALAILLVFTVLFVAGLYYLAQPPSNTTSSPSTHAYFENLSFQLASNKTWHVAVPLSQNGNLHLALASDLPVNLYVRNVSDNSYLLDNQIVGAGNFTLQVTAAMGMLEVGVINFGTQQATVQQFTCIWTS